MKRLLAGALLALLGACARLPPPPAAQPADESRVAAFADWRVAARLAVQRDDKGFSGDLEWRQAGEAFELRMMAPLNGGTFALAGNPTQVSLVTPKGKRYAAADAESLMQQHLGWSIALGGTRYWIRGLPRPGSATSTEVRDAAGRLTDFAQDGWRISILDYLEFDGMALPRRLFLSRDTLKVRIAIKQWQPLDVRTGVAAGTP